MNETRASPSAQERHYADAVRRGDQGPVAEVDEMRVRSNARWMQTFARRLGFHVKRSIRQCACRRSLRRGCFTKTRVL
jgi:D-serine deaminase-like pyridoxal phosphate-dependent protein